MRIFKLSVVLLLLIASPNYAQITSVAESFSTSTLPTNWSTNLSFSTSTYYNCNNSGARYKNLWGSNNNGYVITSDLGTPVSSSQINVSFDFSVKEYYSYSATPAGEFEITSYYSTDGSTWNSISTSVVDGSNYTPTTSCTTNSFSFSSPSSTSLYLKIECDLVSGDFYFSINELSISESVPCSGTPVPGNTVASVSSSAVSSICSGTTVDFSIDGSVGSDVDYQWESSTDGTNYSSISGATSATYSAAISAAAYYRCAVTCSGSTGYSTAKQITLNSAPTAQATSLTFAATSTTITPTFTAASSADGYLIVSHTSALTAGPTDGTDYSSGTSLGGGTVGYSGALTTAALSSLTSNTNYSVTVYSYNESDDGCKMYNTTSPLTGTQYTAPGTVSSPVYANQTTSGFDLSWTAPTSGAASYIYTVYSDDQYSTAVSSSYENVATSGTSVSVTGLSDGTTYYVSVSAIGTGGTGDAYNAGSVSTLCNTFSSFPWTEDFETNWDVSTTYDVCWTLNVVSTSSGFRIEVDNDETASSSTGPSTGNGGSGNYVFLETSSGSSGDYVEMISPVFDITALSAPELSFYYHMYGSDINKLETYVSDDGGTNWTLVKTITGQQHTSSTQAWTKASIDISDYSSNIMKFKLVPYRGSSWEGDISIDDVSIANNPCSGVPANGITASSQSGASGTNTTLSFSNSNEGAGYSYQWQSSTDNVNFSDISGATDLTYATTIGSSSSYYRVKTTCSYSSQYAMSWPIEVTPVNIVNLGSSGSQTNTCGTNITLYDDGGPSGNYSSNASGYIVLENSGTGVISITGTSNTESGYDDLIIYSGSGTSGSVVASYDGLNQTVSVTSSAGQTLTVQLDSDGSVEKAGIELTITYLVDCNGNTANISTPVTYDGSSWSQTPTSTDDVVFAGDYTVTGNEEYANVTVQGADITISPNKSLKVSGNLWIDATSTLTSESSAAGYSQLLVTGQIRNDGTIKQESTLKGNGAVGISSSMKEGFETTSGLTTSALKLYDASTGAYTTVSDLSEPGVGYYGMVGSSGVMSSTGTYDVTGNPVTNFTHSLSYTANQATGGTGSGWNLLGNPYTTLLDWSSVTKTNVNDAIYIWDRSGGKYKYHVNGVTAPTGSYISNALSSSLIPPMHAFWVQANNTGASVSSTMADDGTVSTSPGHFNKNRPDNIIVSVEEIGDSTNVDATWIINNGTSTMGFDGHSDAWKMHNYYGHNVFSTISDKDFAINAMDLSNDVAIPIGITDLDAGIVYMLKIDQLVNDDYYNVWLEDRLRQTKTAVSPEGYPFVDESYNGKDTRFVLHISNAASTNSVAVEELDNSNVSIFSDGTQIHLMGDLDGYHSYRIISANGQTLASGKITEDMRLTAPSTSGIYVVQLIGANTAFSQKLSITK